MTAILTVKTKAYFWIGAVLVLAAFLAVFKSVLMPFVLGAIIAYLLNPWVTYFARRGIPRWLSGASLLFLFILFLLVVMALAIPPLTREGLKLATALPDYIDYLAQRLSPYVGWVQARLGDSPGEDLTAMIKSNLAGIAGTAGGVLGGLKAGGQAAISAATTLVLTPLIAFFMMKDWPSITKWVQDLYPRQHKTMINDLLDQIDRKVAGFIRGQLTVAFVLGLGYAVALTVAGLNYGFLIGLMAGVLSIIPLVGSTAGLLTSVIVAYIQTSGDWSYVAIIGAIFLIGQLIEGNILTPKLVGDNVGMHPLWVIFVLLAGGSLFGILGMLIAVPVAAVIGVLVSFFIAQYKNSPLYRSGKAAKDKQALPPDAGGKDAG